MTSVPPTGPILLIANHPNSFLDAILVGAFLNRPIHFLARGDAFRKPRHARWLSLLNMIPVYRLQDGRENLARNEHAFRESARILSGGGALLVFIEGICVNSNRLQPFRKGAARIAAMNRHLPGFAIVPVSIAYDSFTTFGKRVNLHFSRPILPQTLFPFAEEVKNNRFFNNKLHSEIEKNLSIPRADEEMATIHPLLLLLPALAGLLLHAPLFFPLRRLVRNRTRKTVFYDSVLFGALLIAYPVYVLAVYLLLLQIPVQPVMALPVFILFPLMGYATVVYRRLQSA